MGGISINFLEDMVAPMRSQLLAWGHQAPSAPQEVATLFLNLQRRRIDLRPRSLRVAAGLVPSASVAAGYYEVVRKAEVGEDLNPHLSRSVLNDAGYDDALLNDWAMHHLHLGLRFEADGMVERTHEQLFAIVRASEILLVAVGQHGDWAALR